MSAALWLVLACPAFLAFWLVQDAVDTGAQSRPLPRATQRPPSPHTPHWARAGRIPPQATDAAHGRRHRRGGGTR